MSLSTVRTKNQCPTANWAKAPKAASKEAMRAMRHLRLIPQNLHLYARGMLGLFWGIGVSRGLLP